MQQVIIVIHLMVVTALVALVLYQKSEGGALGIGQSGLFSGRGQANALTRATSILATIFFLTSIALTVLPAWERRAKGGEDWTTAVDQPKTEFKEAPAAGAPEASKDNKPAGEVKDSIFDQLKKAQEQRQRAATPPKSPAAVEAPKPAFAPEAKPASAPEALKPAPEAPKAPAPAVEPEKPALRPTQEAPAATAPLQGAAPAAEAPAKAEPAPKAPEVKGEAAPAPAPAPIWKSPTQ